MTDRRVRFIPVLILVALLAQPSVAVAGPLHPICRAVRWLGSLLGGRPVERALISDVEIGRQLGSGGYGVVHLGTAKLEGRSETVPVAVKNVTPRFASLEARAKAEAEIAAEHEAYAKVHPGEAVLMRIEGDLVMVQTLFPASRTKKDRPALDATSFFRLNSARKDDKAFKRRVTDAAIADLELIHSRGLVHNDIKPANLLISEEGGARFIDFGLARALGSRLDSAQGTLAYLSPRHFNGATEVSPRDDVHALGLTLLEVEMGAILPDLKDYQISRNFLSHNYFAWGRLPDADPRISAERAMAHFTSAKTTTAEYRELLAAANRPARFRKKFAELWTKAYLNEPSEALRDHLIYELYLAPKLGPELVKAIEDPRLRETILARGREMKDLVETPTGTIAWFGWHSRMKRQIEEFLEAFK